MAELLCVKDLTKVYGKRGRSPAPWTAWTCPWRRGSMWGSWGALRPGKTTLLNCISTIDRPTSRFHPGGWGGADRTRGQGLTRPLPAGSGWASSSRTATCWTPLPPLKTLPCPCPSSAPRPPRSGTGWRRRRNCWASGTVWTSIPIRCPADSSSAAPPPAIIVTRPALVLADEPTGALDSKSSRLLLERLEVLNRERGPPF